MTREYRDAPMVGVGVVVIAAGRVLMIRRGTEPRLGEWSLPGGAQALGETVGEAAAREVFEETGLHVTPGPVIDVVDLIEKDDAGRVRWHYTLVDVLATATGGQPQAGDDAAHAEWVSLAAIDVLPMWAETRRIIVKAAAMLGTTTT